MKRPISVKPLISCLLLAFTTLVGACSRGVSEADRTAALSLVEWNMRYAEEEDLEGYMWTLHDNAPSRTETRAAMQSIFDDFDLSYQLVEWEILSIDANSARIRFVQVTRKIRGTKPFGDNQLTGIHTLRKNEEGYWRLFASEFEDVVYLSE